MIKSNRILCNNVPVYRVPGVTIATDIICGFPTETEADFDETMKLCEKNKFPSLFINQFFPRPGTPAARLERIPANLVKTRTKRLTDLFYSYEPYNHKIDEIQQVLVTEISHDKKHFVGHNKFYEQVLLPMKDNLLGKSVKVKIVSATKFSMTADIIDDETDWMKCSSKPVSVDQLSNGLSTNCSDFSETNGLITNDHVSMETGGNVYFYYAFIAIVLAFVYRFAWKLLSDLH